MYNPEKEIIEIKMVLSPGNKHCLGNTHLPHTHYNYIDNKLFINNINKVKNKLKYIQIL